MKKRLEEILKNKKALGVLVEMKKFEEHHGFNNMEQVIVKAHNGVVGIFRLYGNGCQFEMDSEIEVIDTVGDSVFHHLTDIVDGKDRETYDKVFASFNEGSMILCKTFKEIVDLLEYREKAIEEFKTFMEDEGDEELEDDEIEGLHSVAWRERAFDDEFDEDEYNEDDELKALGTYDELSADTIEMSSSILIGEYTPAWVEMVNVWIKQKQIVSWQDMYESFKCLNNRHMDSHEFIEDNWLSAYEFLKENENKFAEYEHNAFAYNKHEFGILGL